MTFVGAVILAAGLSSRMGDFKPLLPIDGRSMISRVAQTMQCVGAAPIIVITGYRAEELCNHLADADVEFIHNHNFSQTQMFESVCLGLKEIHGRCERVLLTPADVPLVRVETVRALLEYNEAFVRPVYQNRGGHPVLITIDLIPKLLAYHGDGGLRRAVESCGTLINNVAVDDPGILLNCNTPEDYSCLKAM